MKGEPFPIRPTGLDVLNFRGWLGRHVLPLESDLTLLVGANGAGKSSLLNAVEWCLFGSEVAKKSCGIDERGEWEAAHRRAEGPVVVELTLLTPEGPAKLVRTRPGDAKPRDPDGVQLQLANEEVLEGEEVRDWMGWNGLPDWSTWKNAFCQHQELLRGRVTDSAERSVQLGALLGLEEYQELGEQLKALKVGALAKAAASELAGIENELERSLERPGRELRELEDRLEKRGLARTEIDEPAVGAQADRLLVEGRRIAELLGVDAPFPDPASCTQEDVLRWARDWEPQVNRRRGEIESELSTLRRNLQELEGAIQGVEPARRRWQDARSALKRWSEEHGSVEELDRQLEELRRDRGELQARERERDALRQLLRQASEAIRGHEEDGCPVCGHRDPALAGDLRRKLEAEPDSLKDRFDTLTGRERQLQDQRKTLARLQSDLELAESAHASLQKNLEARLPEGGTGSSAAPEELPRQWRVRIAGLQGVLGRIEESIGPHRADTEALELLLKWRAARARADAATGDLGRLEAWNELQSAIDEAAGLACDVEALGLMAREAQKERSGERVKAVNETLGAYFGRISNRPGNQAVRVKVKATATRLTYHLVDEAGQDTTPILNQAALNALSFAMLFAQAEDRAKRGEPQWLVLDDPGQSLDADGLAGLAEAVADIARRVPTVLATHPGSLADAIDRSAPASLQRFRLAVPEDGDGPTIQEVHP